MCAMLGNRRSPIYLLFVSVCVCVASAAHALELPPRIESVVMLNPQPHASDAAVIWYDDFTQARSYGEASGAIDMNVGFGGRGGSLPMVYAKGSLGNGGRKLFFGDSPDRRNIVHPDRQFRDVYWRIYVKHQYGWQGDSPAKMSRATSLVSSEWRQGMIAHVWDGGDSLMIDPATGIRDSQVVTTRYNDFANLDWMGARARASFPIHSTNESGYWVPVEARARLNDPGKANGVFRLWINGRQEAQITDLDWHGSYTAHGINAIFLEAYWNDRSPADQTRWFDNFVVSTQPIGPVVAPRNPELIKRVAPSAAPGTWQVEVARDIDGAGHRVETVWRSYAQSNVQRVRVTNATGHFTNTADRLQENSTYFVRIRRMRADEQWSSWSPWHQPFRTTPSHCSSCPKPPILTLDPPV
jgi:hypothetical protein